MQNWKKYYSIVSKKLSSISTNDLGILLCFNVNIDKVAKINQKILLDLSKNMNLSIEKIERPKSTIIRTNTELINALLYSMYKGTADERIILSPDISLWIEKNFAPFTEQIGGQAGIMANQLANLGFKNILINIPYYDETLLSLLNPSIKVLYSHNEKQGSVINRQNNYPPPLTHYIFEYQKGDYQIGNIRIECPRSNRFIVSYDKINSIGKIEPAFYRYSINHALDYSLAIISGFQLISSNNNEIRDVVFKKVVSLIKNWKKKNPHIYVHLELAAINNLDFLKRLIETMLPNVDSIGMNEIELYHTLKSLDYPELQMFSKNQNSTEFFKGALWLWNRFPHIRIHFHHLGYYFVLTSKSNKNLQSVRDALIGSAIGASIKAKHNEIVSFSEFGNQKHLKIFRAGVEELEQIDVELKKHTNISKTSLANHGFVETDHFGIAAIPTIVVEKPKYLVGLGDTISLLALIFENLLGD